MEKFTQVAIIIFLTHAPSKNFRKSSNFIQYSTLQLIDNKRIFVCHYSVKYFKGNTQSGPKYSSHIKL